MRGVILAGLIAASATDATAQVTRCGEEFGKWVCRTERPREQPNIVQDGQRAFGDAYARGQQMQQDQAPARQAQAQSAEDRLALDRRRVESVEVVKGYIASGQCEDARRLAGEYYGARGVADVNALCKD